MSDPRKPPQKPATTQANADGFLSEMRSSQPTNWELNGPPVPVAHADENPFADDSTNPFTDENPFAADSASPPAHADSPQKLSGWEGLKSAVGATAHGFGQGLAGLGDEIVGAVEGGPVDYAGARDAERRASADAEQREPDFYNKGKAISTLLTAPLGVAAATFKARMLGSALAGGITAFGNSEGDAGHQMASTAEGAGLGAAVGAASELPVGNLLKNAPPLVGRTVSRVANTIRDRFDPSRVVARDIGSVMDDPTGHALSSELARQEASVPGSTSLADIMPEEAGLSFAGKMGASRRATIAARAGAANRTSLVDAERKLVGTGFEAIADQPIKLTDDMRLAMIRLGADADAISVPEMPFQHLQNFLSDLKASNRAMHGRSTARYLEQQNLGTVTEGMRSQLAPEYQGLWKEYGDLANRQDIREGLQEAINKGTANQASSRAYGANTEPIGENVAMTPRGFSARLTGWFDPSRTAHAEAVQNMMFNPANAEESIGKALAARQEIMTPQTPLDWSRSPTTAAPAMTGVMGNAMAGPVAPPLSSNAVEAKQGAVQAIRSGVPRDMLKAQLAQQYDSATVAFVMAAMPNRLPQ